MFTCTIWACITFGAKMKGGEAMNRCRMRHTLGKDTLGLGRRDFEVFNVTTVHQEMPCHCVGLFANVCIHFLMLTVSSNSAFIFLGIRLCYCQPSLRGQLTDFLAYVLRSSGTSLRTFSTKSKSTSAIAISALSPSPVSSARTFPQGSTIMEWP